MRFGEFLRLRRHALANELQLFYGYLALDDREALRERLEKLADRLALEKRLQEILGDRVFFLFLEWECRLPGIRVRYDVQGNDLRSVLSSERVNFLHRWLRLIERALAAFGENVEVTVSMHSGALSTHGKGRLPRNESSLAFELVFRPQERLCESEQNVWEILEKKGKTLLWEHPGHPHRAFFSRVSKGGYAVRFLWNE